MARKRAADGNVVKIPQAKNATPEEGQAGDDTVLEHAGIMERTFAKKSTAQMEHASAGRAAKKDGVHISVLAKIAELERMEVNKMQGWLRAFDHCRALRKLDARHGDMFDEVEGTEAL